ncbi:MAG: AtpZ/AtpI family protein [Mycobacteriales bacterium]|nr:AtpZ/AtpI family protein [Frankia sp.]
MAEGTRQAAWSDLGMAWNAVIEFTAAIAVYGVAGWFADKWLHTGHVLFVLGLLGGNALGLYVLIKRSAQADARAVADRATRASV